MISCESVRCSAAARRRRDSLRWFGTYAPMKTPLRLAIYRSPLSCRSKLATLQLRNRSISRILYFDRIEVAIIHLVQPLPAGSSDLPGGRSGCARARNPLRAGSPFDASLFGLALRGVCLAAHVTIRAGALLPHHFTHHPLRAGLFSVALVVAQQPFQTARRPAVSGLAALWCSDFPLPACAGSDRPTCSLARLTNYSKPVFKRV